MNSARVNVPTFDNSVGVLIRAYLKGTLQNNNCAACAVGNLIADALQIQIVRDDVYSLCCETYQEKLSHYYLDWAGSTPTWLGRLYKFGGVEIGYSSKQQVASTGYSRAQLILIEKSFEGRVDYKTGGGSDAKRTYQGLLAVVDVLAKIHGVDLTISKRAAAEFTQEYDRLIQLAALAKAN